MNQKYLMLIRKMMLSIIVIVHVVLRDGYYFTVDYNDSIVYTNYCNQYLAYKYYYVYNKNILNRKDNETIIVIN